MKGLKSNPRMTPFMKAASVAVSFCIMTAPLGWGANLPSGADVAAGAVDIQVNGAAMQINQATQQAIVNWESFSIGQGYGVYVQQPSAQAAMLSRVVGSDPSQILGALQANGIFYLVNPNGVFFGAGAQVDVGQLIATTLNLTDSAFLAGNLDFAGLSEAAVENQGQITAEMAALIGRNVTNSGAITARETVLAAASEIEIGRIHGATLSVDLSGLMGDAILTGSIDASAQTTDGDAGSVFVQGGRVGLDGTIIANPDGSGSPAYVDIASYGGKTVMMPDALIQAAGGEVRINQPDADGNQVATQTRMYPGATIDTMGGKDNGFVEVSADVISVGGATIASGDILFDPLNIFFYSGAANADGNVTGFSPPGDLLEAFADDGGNTSIFETNGTGVLAGVVDNATITFQATNDIRVKNNFNIKTAVGGNSNVNLIFQANDDIQLDANVIADGTGTLFMHADANNGGAGTFKGVGGLTAGTGNVTLISSANTQFPDVTTTGGDVSLTLQSSSGTNSIVGNVTTGGGVLLVRNRRNEGLLRVLGAVATGGGNVYLNADKMSLLGNINLGAGTAVVLPQHAGKQVDIGSGTNNVANTVELADAELDKFTAAALYIGDAGTSNIVVTAAVSADNTNTLVLQTGGSITDSGGSIQETNLSLTAVTGIGTSGNLLDIRADTVAATSPVGVYLTEFDGLTVGTVAGLNGIATTGSVQVVSAGNLDVDQPVAVTGGGTAFLDANSLGNINISSAVTTQGGNITLEAEGNVDLDNNASSVVRSHNNAGGGAGVISISADDEDNGTGNFVLTGGGTGALVDSDSAGGADANIVAYAADMDLVSGGTNSTIKAGDAVVYLIPSQPGVGRTIGIGAVNGYQFELTNTEMNRVFTTLTAGTNAGLVVGDTNSGTISVSAAVNAANSAHLTLVSGDDIRDPGSAQTVTEDHTLTLWAGNAIYGVQGNAGSNMASLAADVPNDYLLIDAATLAARSGAGRIHIAAEMDQTAADPFAAGNVGDHMVIGDPQNAPTAFTGIVANGGEVDLVLDINNDAQARLSLYRPILVSGANDINIRGGDRGADAGAVNVGEYIVQGLSGQIQSLTGTGDITVQIGNNKGAPDTSAQTAWFAGYTGFGTTGTGDITLDFWNDILDNNEGALNYQTQAPGTFTVNNMAAGGVANFGTIADKLETDVPSIGGIFGEFGIYNLTPLTVTGVTTTTGGANIVTPSLTVTGNIDTTGSNGSTSLPSIWFSPVGTRSGSRCSRAAMTLSLGVQSAMDPS